MSDQMLYDSQTTFQGGMQSGFDAGHVADHQYYRGINITCRNGVVDSRPSFKKTNLDFSLLELNSEDKAEALQNYNDALADSDAQQIVVDDNLTAYNNAVAAADASYALAIADPDINNGFTKETMKNAMAGITDNIWNLADTWTAKVGESQSEVDDLVADITANYSGSILFWLSYGLSIMEIADPDDSTDTNDAAIATKLASFALAETSYTDYLAELSALAAYNTSVSDKASLDETTAQMLTIYNNIFAADWVFENGKFQGCEDYTTSSRTYSIVVISGHIFMINLLDNKVTCLTNETNQLNEIVDRCYFVQAGPYMIVQDGIARPRILQGSAIRNSDETLPEIPVGTNMAYGHGRIAVQVSPRHFAMGDIYLSYKPENVLRFKETQFLNEGGGFTVSGKLGNIVSLQYANVSDTSTGDGPLLAICDNGFSTFAVNNPRIQWSNIAIQKIQLLGSGIVGHEASVNINEDILYRSHEGIRSYAVGRTEAASAYKYTELSREMDPYIQADDRHDSRFLTMAFFDKRMLGTTSPRSLKAKKSDWQIKKDTYDADPSEDNKKALDLAYVDDAYFEGIIAFDFSLAGFTKSTTSSQYTRKTTGSYDGIWTGINPTKLFTTIVQKKKRCYAFAKDSNGMNVLYEITKEVTGLDNGSKRIQQSMDLRSMAFKTQDTYVEAPFIHKYLEDITVWIGELHDEVNIQVYSSTDVINRFGKLGELNIKALTSSSSDPQEVGAAQSRAMIKLLEPAESYDETTGHPNRNGNEFQFRLAWEGRIRIRRLLAASRKIVDPITQNEDESKESYPFDTFDQYAYSSDI